MSWRESCKSLNFEEHGEGQIVIFGGFFLSDIGQKKEDKEEKTSETNQWGF